MGYDIDISSNIESSFSLLCSYAISVTLLNRFFVHLMKVPEKERSKLFTKSVGLRIQSTMKLYCMITNFIDVSAKSEEYKALCSK